MGPDRMSPDAQRLDYVFMASPRDGDGDGDGDDRPEVLNGRADERVDREESNQVEE